MLFSSVEFVFFFLPFSLLLYFGVPRRWRNCVLLITGLLFYGWGEPRYVLLMVLTVAADYGFGLAVARWRSRVWLWAAIVTNLGILGFFKYYDFLAATLGLPTVGVALPVGISFYTFQALSYVVDVYRGEREQRNAVSFGAYITMFPQLVAGPIVRYADIRDELDRRRFSVERAAAGGLRFVAGLSKKLLLANPAGEVFEHFSALSGHGLGSLGAWLGIVFYALQIYFDFSAYSDMAVGLGHILGFTFPENFNYPYCATDIKDFWRRWHISLSTWFREYVYIPLGGNRRGTGRTLLNMLVVWSLTGLWHGASFNFLLWGLYYFLLLAAERLFLGRLLERLPTFLRRIYSLFFIAIGWVFFAHTDLGTALSYLGAMFGIGAPMIGAGDLYELTRNALPLAVMLIAATPLPRRLFLHFIEARRRTARTVIALGVPLLLFICTAYLADASYNPFLYFRF